MNLANLLTPPLLFLKTSLCLNYYTLKEKKASHSKDRLFPYAPIYSGAKGVKKSRNIWKYGKMPFVFGGKVTQAHFFKRVSVKRELFYCLYDFLIIGSGISVIWFHVYFRSYFWIRMIYYTPTKITPLFAPPYRHHYDRYRYPFILGFQLSFKLSNYDIINAAKKRKWKADRYPENTWQHFFPSNGKNTNIDIRCFHTYQLLNFVWNWPRIIFWVS